VLENLHLATPAVQACLLDVLSHKAVLRIGSTQYLPIDTRIITLLDDQIDRLANINRELCLHLNMCSIYIPCLRERREDIPILFEQRFVRHPRKRHIMSEPIQELLQLYDWPENLVELEIVAERFEQIASNFPRISGSAAQMVLIEAIGEDRLFQSLLRSYPALTQLKTADPEELISAINLVKRLLKYNNTRLCEKLNINRTTLWRITSQYESQESD